jgi:hypothetical protein
MEQVKYLSISYIARLGNEQVFLAGLRVKQSRARTIKAKNILILVGLLITEHLSNN